MKLTIRDQPDDEAACRLYALTRDELAARSASVSLVGRWFAYDDQGAPVGLAAAARWPDGRVFLTHQLESDTAFAPLLHEALAAIDGPVNITLRQAETDRVLLMRALGLHEELTSFRYNVPFDPVLSSLGTPRGALRFRLVGANDVDMDELFHLDTELRRDVPGTDGWAGNRAWFDDEMSSADFDPDGYRVAIDTETGELLGLCRMWREPAEPKLGLLGVRRSRRTGLVAIELLREALARSSNWGSPTFSAHTARPRLQRHLEGVGATRSGGFIRFLRP